MRSYRGNASGEPTMDQVDGERPIAQDSSTLTADVSDSTEEDACLLRQTPSERYAIEGEHGRGGLGRVLRAHDTHLGRTVAIKELLHKNTANEKRFAREAFITARLEHPGIVAVHDAGRWPNGTPFYAMKLVSGRPLSALLRAATVKEARLVLVRHVAAVADAIAYAHAKGIVHRDLKPSNVIVGDYGETVVIDWGLAKHVGSAPAVCARDGTPIDSASDVTVAGTVLGTPAYMAPEQARGDAADERSDVYALGAILYELYFGEPPPRGAALEARETALRDAGLDADYAAIVAKCLATQPGDRYRDASALASDLHAYLAGRRIRARDYGTTDIIRHWIARHRTLATGVMLALVAFCLVASAAFYRVLRERDRTTAALARSRAAEAIASRERDAAAAERDRALTSEATLLLETDPTRAVDVIRNAGPLSFERALLLARARAAGVANSVAQPTLRAIRTAVGDNEMKSFALATDDRKLFIFSSESAQLRMIDEALAEPPSVVRHREGWAYSRDRGGRIEIVYRSDRGVITTWSVATLPLRLYSDGSTLYWLDRSRTLRAVGSDEHVAARVRAAHRVADGLVVCSTDGKLSELRPDTNPRLTSLGRCPPVFWDSSIGASGTSMLVPLSSDYMLRRTADGDSERIRVTNSNSFYVAMADSTLAAYVDEPGRTWILPGSSSTPIPGPDVGSEGYVAAADGNFAAFGYADGTVVVVDTTTSQHWRFRGLPGSARHVWLSADRRQLVAAGGPEIRVWTLPRPQFAVIGHSAARAYNAIRTTSTVFVDSDDGIVRGYSANHDVRPVHEHQNISFSITLRGEELCSAGWDGRVLCSPLQGSDTFMLAERAAAIRWVASAGTMLAFATAAGEVSTVDGHERPIQRLAFQSEAYRVAISPDARYVASATRAGDVGSADIVSGKVFLRHGHEGWVTSVVALLDGTFMTAGEDGFVRQWTPDLRELSSWNLDGPCKDLRASGATVVVLAGGEWVVLPGTNFPRYHVGPSTRLALSESGTIAIAGKGEILMLVPKLKKLASVRISADEITCLDAVDEHTFVYCTNDGLIASLRPEELEFTYWIGEAQ
jgi:eukaryotic-like serine/threonine-protein kinase